MKRISNILSSYIMREEKTQRRRRCNTFPRQEKLNLHETSPKVLSNSSSTEFNVRRRNAYSEEEMMTDVHEILGKLNLLTHECKNSLKQNYMGNQCFFSEEILWKDNYSLNSFGNATFYRNKNSQDLYVKVHIRFTS